MSPTYLTTQELADLLRLTPRATRRFATQHRFPQIRLSRRVVRYDAESLRTFLAHLQEPHAST